MSPSNKAAADRFDNEQFDNELFDYKEFLATVSEQPGVYRMYNQADDIIYVGKAKNLFKRLSSYFRKNLDNEKTKALVSHIANIDVTVTHTETEALILEHNYIKQYRPKYNVLLRDDKSYPYILLTAHKHPRLAYHRGAKKKKGDYFGPYPNAGAVRETLHLLQKIIPVRQCEDSVYANRTRPCLMYQIERCSAPCVTGLIDEQDYADHVNYVRLFLQGKDNQVLNALIEKMDDASQNLQFEHAAKFRDQIQAIRRVQEQQSVSDSRLDDVDVIGFVSQNGEACVHVLMIRQGKVLGSRSHFPKIPNKTDEQEVFSSFLHQYYLNHNDASSLPSTIIYRSDLAQEKEETSSDILQKALSEMSGRNIQFSLNPRGIRARYLKLANTNASSALSSKLNHKMTHHQRVKALESAFEMAHIGRMECFDISHTMGENTVASCVVFNREGPVKQEYRRYNIEGITDGDDYAAMAQVLDRRYAKQMYQEEQHIEKIPDIIFIDGGKGQLNRAHDIIQQYWEQWPKRPVLIGIAKGVTRKHGLETMITLEGDEFNMPTDSPALHLIQHIRDESHDHAISGHRARRGKARTVSPLEGIEGVGVKRRQALLKHMGGMQELKRATVDEIGKVPGISKTLAEIIHEALKD